jgi:prolyl 4-hydroxylase
MISGLKNISIEAMFRRLDPDDTTFAFPQLKPKVLSKDPWVVYLEKFITPEHADGLVQALYDSGHSFAESSELDLPEGEGAITKRRTSESMFCDNRACQEDPRVLKAHALASNITGFPLGNMEYIQVVRYDTDQYYVKHQDTSETYSAAANGNRIYTLFVYLTDVAEGKGGETSFPDIDPVNYPEGLKVRPKKGAAALWTNVMKDDPDKVDFRSTHEGSPLLERPRKLGANFWMYAYDWRMLAEKGCMNVAVRT